MFEHLDVRDEHIPSKRTTAADRDEFLAWLNRRLGEMPQELSDAFIMCEYEQLSIKNAAQHIGVSVATAKSRLRQARLWLAQDYNHEWAYSLSVPEFLCFMRAAIQDWSNTTEIGQQHRVAGQNVSQRRLHLLSELPPLAQTLVVGMLIASAVIFLLYAGIKALSRAQPRAASVERREVADVAGLVAQSAVAPFSKYEAHRANHAEIRMAPLGAPQW